VTESFYSRRSRKVRIIDVAHEFFGDGWNTVVILFCRADDFPFYGRSFGGTRPYISRSTAPRFPAGVRPPVVRSLRNLPLLKRKGSGGSKADLGFVDMAALGDLDRRPGATEFLDMKRSRSADDPALTSVYRSGETLAGGLLSLASNSPGDPKTRTDSRRSRTPNGWFGKSAAASGLVNHITPPPPLLFCNCRFQRS